MSIPLIGPLIFWFKSKLLRIFSSSYDEGWTKEGSLMGKPVAKERMVFCCAPDEQWSHLSISKVGEHYVIHDQTAKVLNNINRLHLFVFASNYKHYNVHVQRRLLCDVIINIFQAFDRRGQDHEELSTSSCFFWGEKKTHYQKRERIPFKSKHIFNSEIKTILEILSLLWGYLLSFLFLGKPLSEVCFFHMGIA